MESPENFFITQSTPLVSGSPTPFPSIDQNPDDSLKCNQYILNNKTHLIDGRYEGIPENLFINFLCWLVSNKRSFCIFYQNNTN